MLDNKNVSSVIPSVSSILITSETIIIRCSFHLLNYSIRYQSKFSPNYSVCGLDNYICRCDFPLDKAIAFL